MSKTRIQDYTAKRIGNAVARKAFAHMTDPLEETLRASLEAAYWQEMQDCGITRAAHDALLARRAYKYQRCELRWLKDDVGYDLDAYVKGYVYDHRVDNSHLPYLFMFDGLHTKNMDTLVPVKAAFEARQPWAKKIGAMADEIAQQITDRTITVVVKAWPEIAPFVYEILDIKAPSNTPPTPVPFQELLNKHLLALPAPGKPTPAKRVRGK